MENEKKIINEQKNKDVGKPITDSEIKRRLEYFKNLIGHLRGTSRPKIFPFRRVSTKNLEQINEGVSDAQRIFSNTGIATTLKALGGGQGAKTGLYTIPVLTPDRAEKRQNGRRFKEDGDPSFTLTGQDKHGVYDGFKIRRLTPTECERLQGFPDGWTKTGVLSEANCTVCKHIIFEEGLCPECGTYQEMEVEISDSQRYKCLGNGVSVPVIKAIMEKLLKQ